MDEKNKIREEMTRGFKLLNPREKDVLRLRFGLDDGKSRTLEEVGELLGVPKERIRQIESKALKKFRRGDDGLAGSAVPSKPIKPSDRTAAQAELPEDSTKEIDV